MTAPNLANTTDMYRQSFQYSSTVDGLLKNVYIPALNNTIYHATPLLDKFGDFGGTIDFVGNKIIKAFKYQGAGGFGAISEGGDFVKGRNQKGFQGFERIKYLNAFVSLSGPAARTVRTGEGSYVDAISSAMDDTLKLAKMQMERIIGGNGDGELVRFTSGAITEAAAVTGEYLPAAGASGTSEVAITALSGGAYTKVTWLQPGMRVSLVTKAAFDAAPLASSELYGPFEIGNVDYDAETFGLKYVGTANLDMQPLASTTVIVVLEGSYGQIEADGAESSGSDYHCLEPNGLYNLIADTGSIWNRLRATYPHSLKSKVVAAAGAELDEELLMGWVQDMANIRLSVPNTMVTDPKSRLKYFSNQKDDRRFNTQIIDGPSGVRSVGVTIDQYTLMLESLSSLVPGTLLMLNAADFKKAKATNGFEWIEEGGKVFRNYEGRDAMFASAINYMNFVCENPRGQFKATGLSY